MANAPAGTHVGFTGPTVSFSYNATGSMVPDVSGTLTSIISGTAVSPIGTIRVGYCAAKPTVMPPPWLGYADFASADGVATAPLSSPVPIVAGTPIWITAITLTGVSPVLTVPIASATAVHAPTGFSEVFYDNVAANVFSQGSSNAQLLFAQGIIGGAAAPAGQGSGLVASPNRLVRVGFGPRQAMALQNLADATALSLRRAGFSTRQSKTLLAGNLTMATLLRGGFTRAQAQLILG